MEQVSKALEKSLYFLLFCFLFWFPSGLLCSMERRHLLCCASTKIGLNFQTLPKYGNLNFENYKIQWAAITTQIDKKNSGQSTIITKREPCDIELELEIIWIVPAEKGKTNLLNGLAPDVQINIALFTERIGSIPQIPQRTYQNKLGSRQT